MCCRWTFVSRRGCTRPCSVAVSLCVLDGGIRSLGLRGTWLDVSTHKMLGTYFSPRSDCSIGLPPLHGPFFSFSERKTCSQKPQSRPGTFCQNGSCEDRRRATLSRQSRKNNMGACGSHAAKRSVEEPKAQEKRVGNEVCAAPVDVKQVEGTLLAEGKCPAEPTRKPSNEKCGSAEHEVPTASDESAGIDSAQQEVEHTSIMELSAAVAKNAVEVALATEEKLVAANDAKKSKSRPTAHKVSKSPPPSAAQTGDTSVPDVGVTSGGDDTATPLPENHMIPPPAIRDATAVPSKENESASQDEDNEWLQAHFALQRTASSGEVAGRKSGGGKRGSKNKKGKGASRSFKDGERASNGTA